MADNWGKLVGKLKLSAGTELRVQTGAELKGAKFLVLSKWVVTDKYTGPAANGALLIPMSELADFKALISKV